MNTDTRDKLAPKPAPKSDEKPQSGQQPAEKPEEIGGPQGLEPTRYGDWERNGRCVDF